MFACWKRRKGGRKGGRKEEDRKAGRKAGRQACPILLLKIVIPLLKSLELCCCEIQIQRELDRVPIRIKPWSNAWVPHFWRKPLHDRSNHMFKTQGAHFSEANIQRNHHVQISAISNLSPKKIANSRCCCWHKYITGYGLPSRFGVFMMSLNTALEKEYKREEGPKQQYNSKINST